MDRTSDGKPKRDLVSLLLESQHRESQLQSLVNTIPTLAWRSSPDGTKEFLNERWHEYTGLSPEEAYGWDWSAVVHPDDLARLQKDWQRILASEEPGEMEARIRRFDGEYRWFLIRAVPKRDSRGKIVNWFGSGVDIEDRKRTEEKLQQSETELAQIVDTIAQLVIFLSPDGNALRANTFTLQYTGLSEEDVKADNFRDRIFHPEDVERLRGERSVALLQGLPFENEQRIRQKNGEYRWFLIRYSALLDAQGSPVRWYAAGMDIDDRRQIEHRTRNENLALREDIIRSSMFEEIIGSSAALRKVLTNVEKVAPSDSTVLIQGDTGTGKELVARAIHRMSSRSTKAFIRVNCAAIPPSLIASELFGHEKGAFTGAIQRRLGRFEAADGGTIFLDEIGDLPPETQIALPRVLQEREFERVGSSHPVSVNVRVVAASHRNLQADVSTGTFRQDLFYRLNVFPIHVPSLRERLDDIPLLLEYLIQRYAKNAGKRIRTVSKRTLELLQGYDWPGNIRELQNIVERAVLLCESDVFVIDEAWLKREQPRSVSPASDPFLNSPLAFTLDERERQMIESALIECKGQVSGPMLDALASQEVLFVSKQKSLRLLPMRLSCHPRFWKFACGVSLLSALSYLGTAAEVSQSAHIRVSQIGYESGKAPFRAYLMATADEPGAAFRVLDGKGHAVYSSPVGPRLGTWSHSNTVTYRVYALDFHVPGSGSYSISVTGPVPALSPEFAVDRAELLYSGLLLNSKFFHQTMRDGQDYIPNALRPAPAHLNDKRATVYATPPLDANDNIATTNSPLTATGATIDAEGGWWDAGDYMKYVETISYTVALQEIGVRDFPHQMGKDAPYRPAAPPLSISYAGDSAGSPANADFTDEAAFGIDFLLHMWDDKSRTLYYQVGNSQDWANFDYLSDYDIWRLPQADDHWNGCDASATFICHQPAFVAGPANSKISPNLAGRLAADFAVCYQLNRESKPALANRCLKNAEDIFELANTSLPDPAASVSAGSCAADCLLTIMPFDGYPETVWDDDMELGATELYLALRLASNEATLPPGLPRSSPNYYLRQATRHARNYIDKIYKAGASDTLNLYDLSGLAHFELYRALGLAGHSADLSITRSGIASQLLKQVDDAIGNAKADAWDFGGSWSSDTTSHGAGLSVMASEAHNLTGRPEYDIYSQRWMANILGANAWGSSFIVGAGSKTFPNCIQHQVANLQGALDGTSRGTPVLWGAATEGPSGSATSGQLDGMLACPANGVDEFYRFNGNDGVYDASQTAVYQDNVQSYTTTEPAIDLTATSFLMWSWRWAHQPEPGALQR